MPAGPAHRGQALHVRRQCHRQLQALRLRDEVRHPGRRRRSAPLAVGRGLQRLGMRLAAPGAAVSLPAVTANPLDLRSWLDEIRELGELKEVRGADWDLELGAISELNGKKDVPPALLFDEIRGYPKGFRVLTCSTSSPARLSSILRFSVQRTHRGLVEALRGKPAQWQAAAKDFSPVSVDAGPVLENIQKQVDVLAFPSP